jgi:uncharacterized membrane protein HdeD (DUF308 family)
MKKSNSLTQAVREYGAGIVATRTIQRLVAPLILMFAMCFAFAAVFGLLDALTGWHLSAPVWAHAIGALALTLSMALLVIQHVKRMREAGREYLRGHA